MYVDANVVRVPSGSGASGVASLASEREAAHALRDARPRLLESGAGGSVDAFQPGAGTSAEPNLLVSGREVGPRSKRKRRVGGEPLDLEVVGVAIKRRRRFRRGREQCSKHTFDRLCLVRLRCEAAKRFERSVCVASLMLGGQCKGARDVQ